MIVVISIWNRQYEQQTIADLLVFAYKNIIGLIVSHAFYVFTKADMLSPFALATMNLNKMIFDILMQFRFTKMFYLEMIVRLDVLLCSYASFSSYNL